MIVGYLNLYSHREKGDIISFEITNEKISLFVSFQTVKCTGKRTLTFLCKEGLVQCLVIRSSVFFQIYIFVTTNNLINKTISRSSFP